MFVKQLNLLKTLKHLIKFVKTCYILPTIIKHLANIKTGSATKTYFRTLGVCACTCRCVCRRVCACACQSVHQDVRAYQSRCTHSCAHLRTHARMRARTRADQRPPDCPRRSASPRGRRAAGGGPRGFTGASRASARHTFTYETSRA